MYKTMVQKDWSLQFQKNHRDEKELVENMPKFLSNAQVCETCQQGKANKIVISSKSSMESYPETSAYSYGCLLPNENRFTEW